MKARICNIESIDEIKYAMKRMNVDVHGIRLMAAKGIFRIIVIEDVTHKAANILKQEMLSIGAEAAVNREVINLAEGSSEVLLMGTLQHYERLVAKLRIQPFGLSKIAGSIKRLLSDYEKKTFKIFCGIHCLRLGEKVHIMGVLNVTPDSFSDGGRFNRPDKALEHAQQMVSDGADIIDVGGESSRPGAKKITVDEELRRVIPVIKKLAKIVSVPISIDTCKASVAQQALDNGASIINDISAMRMDKAMVEIAAIKNAPVILMHMQGIPQNMQKSPSYNDVVSEIISFLDERINFVRSKGVKAKNIIIDPGIGFGKTTKHNLQILKRLKEFRSLGRPVLIGASRKSFIGNILDSGVNERLDGSLAANIWSIENGAHILRVHDVRQTYRAVTVIKKIREV